MESLGPGELKYGITQTYVAVIYQLAWNRPPVERVNITVSLEQAPRRSGKPALLVFSVSLEQAPRQTGKYTS